MTASEHADASANVSLSIAVAWGEMDALGHVNNVVYFRYLESARIEYIRRMGFGKLRGAPGGPTTDAQDNSQSNLPPCGFILQSVQCRFRRPVLFPDTLRVSSRCVRIEVDRFTLAHEVVSERTNEVVALGEGTIVCYDYARASKTAMPAAVRDAILSLNPDAALHDAI